MFDVRDPAWLDARMQERVEERNKKRIARRDPGVPVIDAGTFAHQLAKLAHTILYSVEREGPKQLTHSPVAFDIAMILRFLTHTYKVILFMNADDRRYKDTDYDMPYSFAILPLVRTMIDGFYNCTALLDDPTKSKAFRVSGHFRLRESLAADEARYGTDPKWEPALAHRRASLVEGLRADGYIEADMSDNANRWMLLSEYLRPKHNSPHKDMIRQISYGFWKEYSSISHASYDGLIGIFPFISRDILRHDQRTAVADAAERVITMHIGRAAVLLLALLTWPARSFVPSEELV